MQLQVKVFSGVSALQQDNKLFERIIEIHDDIVIPYQMIVDSLKFFFGSSSVVQFNLL